MLRIPHCLDTRLTEGDKVVSLKPRPRSTSQKHNFSASSTHFCSEAGSEAEKIATTATTNTILASIYVSISVIIISHTLIFSFVSFFLFRLMMSA
jgi:hypothetical protein